MNGRFRGKQLRLMPECAGRAKNVHGIDVGAGRGWQYWACRERRSFGASGAVHVKKGNWGTSLLPLRRLALEKGSYGGGKERRGLTNLRKSAIRRESLKGGVVLV